MALRTTSAEVDASNLSSIRFRYHLTVSTFSPSSEAIPGDFAPWAIRRIMLTSRGVREMVLSIPQISCLLSSKTPYKRVVALP